MIVTFDFDLTLLLPKVDNPHPKANVEFVAKFKEHLENGDTVYIVTSRNDSPTSKQEILSFLRIHNLDNDGIYFTNGELKAITLKRLKADLHYDDDPEELAAARQVGIRAINAFNKRAAKAFQEWFDSL